MALWFVAALTPLACSSGKARHDQPGGTTSATDGATTDIVELADRYAVRASLDIMHASQLELERCGDLARPVLLKSHNPLAGKLGVRVHLHIQDGAARATTAALETEVPEVPALGPCLSRALEHMTVLAAGSYDGDVRLHLCVQPVAPHAPGGVAYNEH